MGSNDALCVDLRIMGHRYLDRLCWAEVEILILVCLESFFLSEVQIPSTDVT